MARHPADGSENDNVHANASGLLAEVEALRHRLAALEARLPENPRKEPPRRQPMWRASTKTAVCLATGAGLTILAGASLVYGQGAVHAAVDALTISKDGRIGIGTVTPTATLDVVGGLVHVAGSTAPTVTSQGAYLGWNALTGGTGETDFINNQGGGSGGFAFMNTPLSGDPRTTLMVISGDGGVRMASLNVDGSASITALNVAGSTTMKTMTLDQSVKIEGASGRNMFSDSEKAGDLRVGAAWSTPGIYSQKGDVVVGSQSENIWLYGKVAITKEGSAEKRRQAETLYVDGGIKATGAVDGNMKVVYQRDDEPQKTSEKPLWRYHMSLTAAKYGGRTKMIPSEILTKLCGTPDGCEVRLGMTRWDDANKTETASASNRLYIGNNGRWRVSWPRDAEGVVGNGRTEHAMNAWNTCYLTDGTYENYQDKGDKQTGLQLYVGNANNNPARTCELTLIP